MFWNWLLAEGGALDRTGEALSTLLTAINAWSEDPATRANLGALGHRPNAIQRSRDSERCKCTRQRVFRIFLRNSVGDSC